MKNNYHMIDYIHENSRAVEDTLVENEPQINELITRVDELGIKRVVLTGVGSSYTAILMAAPLFHYHCPMQTFMLNSFELSHYADRLLDERTLVVSVSRSGERGWVVDSHKDAIERGAYGVAMTGTPDSLLAQSGDFLLVTREGPEITFPKTKSVIACASLLMRLGLALARQDDDEAMKRLKLLRSSAELIELVTHNTEADIINLMPAIYTREPVMIGGTGSNYGAALEAGIKIQESTYTITHGEHTSELLHGSLGPFEKDWLMILAITNADLKLSQQLFELVGKFGAYRIGLVEPGCELDGLAEHEIKLPVQVDPLLSALFYLPPLQLITYYWAVEKGMNPDAPVGMRDVLDMILPPNREEPELRG